MDAVSYSLASKQAQRIEKFIADPDSTSGIVTVPKVIEAGENITIPSGRVAVLPNVQVDGTLNVLGDVFIPSGATFSKVVETEGNQTIAGIKTFSSSPIVPTPTAGTQVANKDYVDGKPTLPIGAILTGYTIFDNCIVAFGGEFNRADYPKLWTYLQANPTLVKTQAQWTTESTANGGICGFFSDGDGTTTFRVPNLDKAFLRPDSRGVGGYQGDAIRNITGTFGNDCYTSVATGAFSQPNELMPVTNSAGGGADLTSYKTYFDASRVVPTSTENRPKNIAVLPLIVAK